MTTQTLPMALIDANPDQPRQTFDKAALDELAASIASQGLIQPITVVPRGERYMIVAGERRWRAHKILGRDTIAANVSDGLSDRDVMLQAIIENAMRRDVNILEEAVAYARCVAMGMSEADLAAQLGVAPFRVRWRLSLLNLRTEYQTLTRSGQLTASQALELAKLDPADQDRLFRAIKAGECATTLALQSRAAAIREEAAQVDAFADLGRPSERDTRLANGFEARVRRVAAVLQEASVDNEVVAVRKVDPNRAESLADLFQAMRGDLLRIELALRASEPVQTAA
jgi:ParB family chromosome partitioning protein